MPGFSSLFTLPKSYQGDLSGSRYTQLCVSQLYLWSDPAQGENLSAVSLGSPGYVAGTMPSVLRVFEFHSWHKTLHNHCHQMKTTQTQPCPVPQCCGNQRALGCSVLICKNPVSRCLTVQLPNLNSLQNLS